MKRKATVVFALGVALIVPAAAASKERGATVMTSQQPGSQMIISHADARAPSKGPSQTFTGSVTVSPLFQATAQTRASGASVTFAPGARSAWHTHPTGQTLIVTSGTGWIQEWGGPKRQITVGDVIWTPPGVKHWHGATTTESLTHIAIQEHVDGKVVEWMEHVSDEQYTVSH